jgi:D-glycero-D-manno-heptose 1,7-bisphosphate phosphatase
LDDVRVCFHDDRDGCACRKPAPGLILQAATDLGIDLEASFMVGDRWKDVEAGRRAGCRTVLIRDGGAGDESLSPDHCAGSLLEGTGWILDQIQPSREGR